MFTFHINYKDSPKTDEMLVITKANQETLSLIIKNQTKIMAQIDDLQKELADLRAAQADLQASVDLEQEQIAALLATNAQVVTTLNEKIAALEAEKANSPTPEALQGIIDGVKEVVGKLATSKADIEGTIPDVVTPPVEPA